MTALVRRPSLPSWRQLARWGKPLAAALAAVAILVALALYVFPTRTWLDQRADRADAQAQLAELEAERAALEARAAALETDAEIEAIARSEFGLVKPGEEAYATLPGAKERPRSADVFPFGDIFVTGN